MRRYALAKYIAQFFLRDFSFQSNPCEEPLPNCSFGCGISNRDRANQSLIKTQALCFPCPHLDLSKDTLAVSYRSCSERLWHCPVKSLILHCPVVFHGTLLVIEINYHLICFGSL